MAEYCMFKGKLKLGVPFLTGYHGNPHYAIVVENGGDEFVVLTNVKSDSTFPGAGAAGYHVLYTLETDFRHPMTSALNMLAPGLYRDGFPALDYVHDNQLLDLSSMRPILLDTDTQTNDINGLLDTMLQLNREGPGQDYLYHGSSGSDPRKGWPPVKDVTVYGFGFLFEPEQNGLHETHMNQGNPVVPHNQHMPDHSRENGVNQDGAVMVEVDGQFQALFVAFQTQLIPTDARGYPTPDAHRILPGKV